MPGMDGRHPGLQDASGRIQRQPMNRDLVSFDTRIRDAAYKEGFTILPPHIH
jgi:hypothetical protein